MIFRINVPRILNRLRQKGGDIPTWPRVKRLQSFESEWDVWGCASGNESSCAETHTEPANSQREAFAVLQPRNHLNKRKLQVQGVVLNWRGWLRLTFYYPGNALGEKPQAFPQMHIGQESDALQQIGIGPFAANPEVGIIMSLEPFAQLAPKGHIPQRVILPQWDAFDRVRQISAIGLIGQIGIVLVKPQHFETRGCEWDLRVWCELLGRNHCRDDDRHG